MNSTEYVWANIYTRKKSRFVIKHNIVTNIYTLYKVINNEEYCTIAQSKNVPKLLSEIKKYDK